MNYLITILFLINALVACTQTDYKQDTIYFDINNEKTTIIEDAMFARVFKIGTTNKIVGMTREYYYPSWVKKFEGKMLTQNPDKLDGICSYYYSNGKLNTKVKYEKGKSTVLELWNEDGMRVKCKDTIVEVAPLTELKLGSSVLSNNTSRTIYTMNMGFLYKSLFIRYQIFDEGLNPEFTLASSLVSAYYSGGISLLKNIFLSKETKENKILTKNTIFFTYDRSVASAFMAKKPYDESKIFNKTQNASLKTFELKDPTKILYICIQNDNYKTDATARIDAFGSVNYCGN